MRPIDADTLEKTLGDWIRDHWTDVLTGYSNRLNLSGILTDLVEGENR